MREELRRHYRIVRESAAIKPMFLSDYIFFNVQGKGVQLGRVCHAPFGGALHTSDTVDVTEYQHVPQNGFAGFLGTFNPLRNEHFNQQVRGSLQFVRHRDVPRRDVVVFNVQMFKTGDAVRVCLSSLRELERASPVNHKLPSQLPATHAKQRASDRAHDDPQRRQNARRSAAADENESDAPLAKKNDRIEVHWTADPVGWFAGTVTSNRKQNGVWVSRVLYDSCASWPRQHHVWHCLHPAADEPVTWRFANNNR